MKFAIGDVVVLNSGGPKMTIFFVYSEPTEIEEATYKCQWFDKAKVCVGLFSESTLKPAESEGPHE